jgi:hypothetical protein
VLWGFGSIFVDRAKHSHVTATPMGKAVASTGTRAIAPPNTRNWATATGAVEA